ncbi:MAG TPA: WYL domain-containing protein [Anaerolineae bacterium]|nr:WYL domain-containing protein [Anaerolineae bacterium]
MTRMTSRAARLRQIEELLYRSSHGLSAIEIAEATGVDRRTVYRDVELLGESGVPLWQDEGRFGIVREDYLSTVRLTLQEALSLFIAGRLLARFADERDPHIVSALTKLAGSMPEPLASSLARTAESVARQPVNDRYVQVREAITLGWALRRKVRLWYRSPRSGEVTMRDFSPYFIEAAGAGYSAYAIGYDDSVGAMRTFKLDRLDRAQMLDETYEIPPEFDPQAYLASAWGIMTGESIAGVVLEFSPRAAPLVKERRWHASQEVDDLANGGLLFTVKVSEPREMAPWIRSWGGDVEVLEPPELRAEIGADAWRAAAHYERDDLQAAPGGSVRVE